jgi:DNA-binding response OmpR family regulator
MGDIKVLLADDEADIVEVMAKKVNEAGYQTVIAYDGEDAWRKIQSELPDMVLLDINMPGMNGFEVLNALRKNTPGNKWVPVIMVSARTELNDMQKSFDLEADHYITKPCGIEEVLKAIRLMAQLIPQHKAKDEI